MNLYSKSNLKLLSFLCRITGRMYEREIARASGISIGAVNQSLKEFLEKGIVEREKKGRMYFYRVNHEKALVRQFKIFLTVFELDELVNSVKEKCGKIVLFGSCAEGTDAAGSDVDVLFLTREKKEVGKKIAGFAGKQQRKLSAAVFSPSEWLEIKKKNPAFYNEASNGIVLWRKL